MNALPQTSVVPTRTRSNNRSDKKDVDRWINEGGHFTDLEALRESVRRIGRTLLTDFTNGSVGEHHNTFQHRSRVLRQLTAKLRATTKWRALPDTEPPLQGSIDNITTGRKI